MCPDPTVFGLFENETKRVEKLLRAQPDKFISPQVDIWLKDITVALAGFAINAVRGNNQIGIAENLVIVDFRLNFSLKFQINAKLFGAIL